MRPNLRLIDLGTSCLSSCIPATTPACLRRALATPVTSLAMIGVRASMQSAILQFDAHRAWVPCMHVATRFVYCKDKLH